MSHSHRTKSFATDNPDDFAIDLDGAAGGTDQFSWDEVERVQVDAVPHENAFDTEEFYKIPLVATRPIDQTYTTHDGQEVVMRKPADELRGSAWSLENRPITLDHPSSRIVDAADLVHGFVRKPEWDADEAKLHAYAYIPVTDARAQEYIKANDGVSPGFWYDADTAVEREGLDAYQRNLLFDHLAIVDKGRCSREEGCGLAADGDTSEPVVDSPSAVRGFTAADDSGECSDGPCSCGLHTVNESDSLQDNETNSTDSDTTIMTDAEVSDLALDAIAEENDAVAELHEKKEDLEAQVDSLEGDIEEKDEQLEATKAELDSTRETLDEFEKGERTPKAALVDDITSKTDKWDEDDLLELDRGRLEDRLELVEELDTGVSTPGADSDNEDDSTVANDGGEDDESDYRHGQTYNLSETA